MLVAQARIELVYMILLVRDWDKVLNLRIVNSLLIILGLLIKYENDTLPTGKEVTDDEMEKIIRKMAASIGETLAILKNKGHAGEDYLTLQREEAYAASLLP